MSRGSGAVQRKIIEAFAAEPTRRFTVGELAEAVYPGQAIGKSKKDAVRRALIGVAPKIGPARSRVGVSGKSGWQHLIGLKPA